MKPVSVTLSNVVASSSPIPLDINAPVFTVGIGVSVTGTISYTVEHSYDDPQAAGYTAAGATWFPHPTIVTKAVKFDGSYTSPVRAVRLTQVSGTGSATMTVIQQGLN